MILPYIRLETWRPELGSSAVKTSCDRAIHQPSDPTMSPHLPVGHRCSEELQRKAVGCRNVLLFVSISKMHGRNNVVVTVRRSESCCTSSSRWSSREGNSSLLFIVFHVFITYSDQSKRLAPFLEGTRLTSGSWVWYSGITLTRSMRPISCVRRCRRIVCTDSEQRQSVHPLQTRVLTRNEMNALAWTTICVKRLFLSGYSQLYEMRFFLHGSVGG